MIFKKRYKTYTSISNIPIGVFSEVLSSGNLGMLVLKGNPSIMHLAQVWEIIYNEYLQLFGIPENFRQFALHKKKAGKLWQDVFVKGLAWKKPLAQVQDLKAESYLKESEVGEVTIEQVMAEMGKRVGFYLNPRVVTVKEYYGYKKQIEREAEG